MKRLLKKLGAFFETLPDALRRRKWTVWGLFIAVTIGMFSGISGNTFDMTMDSWFSDDDPTKQALNHFKHQFGSDDVIYLVYRPKGRHGDRDRHGRRRCSAAGLQTR